jgi:hypothetical protein
MLVGPKPDHHYRRTDTKELIAPGGAFEADPCDLDIVRALECGDLVKVDEAAAEDEAAPTLKLKGGKPAAGDVAAAG